MCIRDSIYSSKKHIATALDMYHDKNTWLIGIVNTMKCRRIVNMKSTILQYTDNYTDMHYITVHWQLRRTCTTTTIHVNFTDSGIRWRRIANVKSTILRYTVNYTDMYHITVHWQLRRTCTTTPIHVNFTVGGIRWRCIANAKSQTARHTHRDTSNWTRHV